LATRLPSPSLRELKQIGADEKFAAAVCVLLEQARERRAAVAGNPVGVSGEAEPDRFLGQEHRDVLALIDRGGADEKPTVTRSASSSPVARLITTLAESGMRPSSLSTRRTVGRKWSVGVAETSQSMAARPNG
jgi:hypothetical protein